MSRHFLVKLGSGYYTETLAYHYTVDLWFILICKIKLTLRRNKLLQTNDWAEILSHIINYMNLQ